MKILRRYLLREHLAPFVFAFAALTGLMVLNQVARQFSNLIGKGLPWSAIGALFGLSLPFITAMTAPMSVLVAVLHAFSRLASDSEITALKATGVDLRRFIRPVLLAGCVIGLVEFVWVDQVLPRANHRLKNLMIDIARKKPSFNLREQVVNEVVPGQLFLRAGRIDQAADRMKNVVIYDLGDRQHHRTIYADSGYIRYARRGTDLYLTLFDGYIHDYDRAQEGQFRRIFYRTDLVRVAGVTNQFEQTGENEFRGDREMSLCEMEAKVQSDLQAADVIARERRQTVGNDALALVGVAPPLGDTSAITRHHLTPTLIYCRLLGRVRAGLVPPELRAEAPQRPEVKPRPPGVFGQHPPVIEGTPGPAVAGPPAQHRPPMMADAPGEQLRGQLTSLEARRRAALQNAAGFQVEIHKKYSLSFSCLVFVLIGAPVALRFPRGGMGLVIGASCVIFGVYYIGLIGGEPLADRLLVTPFWAMWTPNLVMTAVGLVLFFRLGTERATARGGWWADALQRLRDRRRARRLRAARAGA